jgi:hypothetical protein
MKAFFQKTPENTLRPADDAGAEVLQGLKVGAFVAVEVTRPRNIQHHRLYWALVSHIADAIDADREAVSDVLKLRTGHCTIVQTKKERISLPRSISFSKMDQAEFRVFFERCVRVVCEEFLPGQKPSALTREIEQMVGIEQLATER